MLAAFALVLSYVETFIPLPVPVPGAKLGLANIAVLMALVTLDARSAFVIAVVKTLVIGLLFGSPLMVPYSAAGTLLAFFAMRLLVVVPGLRLELVSVAGSLCHVAGQLAVASLMLGTQLVWYSFPVLAVVACVTGVLTGRIAACLVERVSLREDAFEDGCADAAAGKVVEETARGDMAALSWGWRGERAGRLTVDARMALAAFVVYVVATFCAPGPWTLAACAVLALVAAFVVRIRPRAIAGAMMPLASILVITTIAQVLYSQQGEVVAVVGPVAVTEEALGTVAFMFVRLLCVMMASVAFMHVVDAERLVGAISSFLAPLKRLGVRTEPFVLALDLALRFVPVLLADFKLLKSEAAARDGGFGAGGVIARLRAYGALMSALATRSFSYADRMAERFVDGSYRLTAS